MTVFEGVAYYWSLWFSYSETLLFWHTGLFEFWRGITLLLS